MSTRKQLADYADRILKSPISNEIIDRITMKLMKKFRTSTPDEREEIVRILDSLELFFNELKIVSDENKNMEQ